MRDSAGKMGMVAWAYAPIDTGDDRSTVMPRVRRNANPLAVVETQVSRMQDALANLKLEIARLLRMQERSVPREARQAPKTLREARQIAERQFLLEIGEQCGWNRAKMARTLKIDRKSLYRHMQQLDMLAAHPAMSAPARRPASKAGPAPKAWRRRP